MGKRQRRDEREFNLRKQPNESQAEFAKRMSARVPKVKAKKVKAAHYGILS